jgi:hypothetical protein
VINLGGFVTAKSISYSFADSFLIIFCAFLPIFSIKFSNSGCHCSAQILTAVRIVATPYFMEVYSLSLKALIIGFLI